MPDDSFLTGFAAGVGTTVLLVLILGLGFAMVRPWLRIKMSGGRGSLLHVLAMRLRGTPPMLVVDAYTSLLHSGRRVSLMEVESQYVANRASILDSRDLIEHVVGESPRDAQ